VTGRAATAWRNGGLGGGRNPTTPAADALMLLRRPVEHLLTFALRRAGRRRPDIFERLGEAGEGAFLIVPTDFPVAFRLRPGPGAGRVEVVRSDDRAPRAARISGPITTLLALFDGRADADAAFFSRQIRIDGDTHAVVALHNTLEAAELTLADLLGVDPPLRDPLNAALCRGLDRVARPSRAR
jgi:predicted lipid carrier protein YhbT